MLKPDIEHCNDIDIFKEVDPFSFVHRTYRWYDTEVYCSKI